MSCFPNHRKVVNNSVKTAQRSNRIKLQNKIYSSLIGKMFAENKRLFSPAVLEKDTGIKTKSNIQCDEKCKQKARDYVLARDEVFR